MTWRFQSLMLPSLIEEEGPPVLHGPAVVVARGVAQAGHALAPVDDPAAHAVRGEVAVAVQHGGGERARLLVRLAPGLDRGEHGLPVVEVVVVAPVGHEVDVAAGGHVALHAAAPPA